MSESPAFRSGFVAVVGRPNVGKSALMNALLAQKVAAVSPRPQTTRRRQLGIYTTPTAQVIFIDTPGIHNPLHKLGEFMNSVAVDALRDADVILWLVDASGRHTLEDEIVAGRLNEMLERGPLPLLMVLTKCDLLQPEQIDVRREEYLALCPSALPFAISAARHTGLEELLAAILERLPEGPPFYDEDQVTDLYERDIAVDLIREAVLRNIDDEIPHAVAVRLEEYSDRGEDTAYIAATLVVEREGHKGIVIGKGAEMLKRIGTTARKEIESMTGRKVFLDLHVKVVENWRNNPSFLRQIGYSLEKK